MRELGMQGDEMDEIRGEILALVARLDVLIATEKADREG